MTTQSSQTGPIRIAVANDSPVVVKGLAAMLAGHADRVRVVELDTMVSPKGEDVDLVLKDTFGFVENLRGFIASTAAPVVVFSFVADPCAVRDAFDAGAVGYVSKTVTPERLVSSLYRARAGERVVAVEDVTSLDEYTSGGAADWPGRADGLSARESEILALICRGLSNQQVAKSLYLSINTVKTYIRTAYRTMGVDTRSQAVIWGLEHGFAAIPSRTRAPGRG